MGSRVNAMATDSSTRDLACSNCKRSVSKYASKEWCSRCYRYQLRHDGRLPPPDLIYTHKPNAVQVSFEDEEFAKVQDAAKASRVPLAEWLRRLARDKLGLGKRRYADDD